MMTLLLLAMTLAESVAMGYQAMNMRNNHHGNDDSKLTSKGLNDEVSGDSINNQNVCLVALTTAILILLQHNMQ